jgi:Leucine-rich repeat (LRR) protein
MKKNDWILIISVILYSWMFYQQTAGINFLIFSVAAIVLLIWSKPSNLKDSKWYVAASGTLVSGVCVALFGTAVSVVANIVSLSLLSAYSISRNSSVVLAGLYAVYSYLSAIGFIIADLIRRKSGSTQTRGSRFWIRLGIGAGILIVLILFFVLYQRSNPLFLDLTRKIKLDFISWPWVRFTFLGFVLLYGFFYHRNFPGWLKWDASRSNFLNPELIQAKENKIFGKSVNVRWEISSGLILLVLLNLLLMVVNTLDIYYLWINPTELPTGMTYSDYVHQGTTNMIISIAIAILIILFFFRGHLNFAKGNKPIMAMAVIWIVQNMVVLISTGYRNYLYVAEYSLTYRRVGVYIWLTLTLIGLVTTFVKIFTKKSNWYLFRANGWAFYLVLVLFACQNWDLVITKFNIQKSKNLDKYYLLSMGSSAVLPELMKLPAESRDIPQDIPTDYDERFASYKSYDVDEYNDPYYRPDFNEELNRRMYEFLTEYKASDWQSWNKQDRETARQIYQLSETGVFSTLSLKNMNLDSMEFADVFYKISELDLSNNNMQNFDDLASFSQLKTLRLTSNGLYTTAKIPMLSSLENLYIDGNSVTDFSGITRQKNLQYLSLAQNTADIDLKQLSTLTKLRELDLSGTNTKDYTPLKDFVSLRSLNLNTQQNTDFSKIPVMNKLEAFDLSGNHFGSSNAGLMSALKEFTALKKINLASNDISTLYVLTDYYFQERNVFGYNEDFKTTKALFPSLEDLNIAGNSVTELDALTLYPNLKRLDLSSNSVSDISILNSLKNLEYLNLSGTMVNSLDSIKGLSMLKELDISGTNIVNADALRSLSNIEVLTANNCQITDFSVLKNLKKLRILQLSNNYYSDISFMTGLNSLEVLYLSGSSGIADYTPLYGLDNLKVLYLDSYLESKVQRELKENLPGVRIIYGYYNASVSYDY